MKKISLFFGLFLSLAISCDRSKKEYCTYHNKSFNEVSEIARDSDLPFCIILSDSLNSTPDQYFHLAKTYEAPANRVVYNFVNVNLKDNRWYVQLLSPQIYPVACIFDTYGQLIDLIPGISKESFAYTTEVINSLCPHPEFHYNQKYDKDKIALIRSINNTVALKLKVDNGQYSAKEIDSLFQMIEHPYLLNLKLQNQLQFREITEAKKTAKDFLSFDSAQNLIEYYDEFMAANQLLDSTYNSQTAPLIEASLNKIELSECYLNHTYNIDINIINKGEKPLKISDILTSCSCVELISSKKHIVNSGETLILEIEFTPDAIGDLFREIYIASNSKDTPIYVVSINAIVQE